MLISTLFLMSAPSINTKVWGFRENECAIAMKRGKLQIMISKAPGALALKNTEFVLFFMKFKSLATSAI